MEIYRCCLLMDILFAITLITLFVLVKGDDYTLWICGSHDGSTWKWNCGPNTGSALSSLYENWDGGTTPIGTSNDAIAMSDVAEMKFTVYPKTTKLKRIMCEATISNSQSCPNEWGRIVYGADSCWQLRFRSQSYTWSEATADCASVNILGVTPYLCVVETQAEYTAIKNWLTPHFPTTRPTTALLNDNNPTTTIMTTLEPTSVFTSDPLMTTVYGVTTTSPSTHGVTTLDTTTTALTSSQSSSTPKEAITSEHSTGMTSTHSTYSIVHSTSSAVDLTTTSSINNQGTSDHKSNVLPYSSQSVLNMTKVTVPSTTPNKTTSKRPLILIDLYTPELLTDSYNVDDRVFAISVGVLAIILMIAFAIGVCLVDIPVFVRDFKRLRRNLRCFFKRFSFCTKPKSYQVTP